MNNTRCLHLKSSSHWPNFPASTKMRRRRRRMSETRDREAAAARGTRSRRRKVCVYGEDSYRVPHRDPRDRVIRIEMNVNPLNTIPGQNTATRGSESGQIRYRAAVAAAAAVAILQDVAARCYLFGCCLLPFFPAPPQDLRD